MPEAQITPLDQEDELYRYTRRSWRHVGIDAFTRAPGNDDDMCHDLINVLPPLTNVIQRRFGYATFIPVLDTGIASGSDQLPLSALHGTGFDGETGYVYTSTNITWSNNPTQSIELWFETDSTVGGFLISVNASAQITASETQYFGIYMNATGNIGVGLFDGAVVTLSALTTASYNDSNGHMLDVTITGGVVLIYVDGILVLTTSVTTTTGTHSAFWRLAQAPNSGSWVPTIDQWFQGFLSHVSIFPFVLTQTQVTKHFNAITTLGGTQSLYETAVSNDAPTYFWFLDETTTAVPPSKAIILQNAKGTFTGSTGTVTFSLAVTVGHIIFVTIAGVGSLTNAVTDNQSNSYTTINSISGAGGDAFNLETLSTTASSTGILTLTFTNSGGGHQQYIIAQEIQNATLPIDGEAITSTTSPTFSSPAITTLDEPDIILSYCFTDSPSIIPASGNGFTTNATLSGIADFDNLTHTLIATYEQTNTIGTFSCSYVQSGNHRAISSTIGIPISIPVTTPGNNAFDSADSNNGFYAVVSKANSICNNTATETLGVMTFTVTASGEDIQIGDTQVLCIVGLAAGSPILTVTDSIGNVWSNASPNGLTFNSAGEFFQIWTASMLNQLAIGGTYTITVTFTGSGVSNKDTIFFNYPALSLVQTSAHAASVTTALASGGVTLTAVPAVLLSFAAQSSASAFAATPTAPFTTTPFANNSASGMRIGVTNAYISTIGTYTDSWTAAGGANGADVLLAFNTSGGFFLGQFIIVT
jgi:Concanavalin A-like lectin/glucanases superfamily